MKYPPGGIYVILKQELFYVFSNYPHNYKYHLFIFLYINVLIYKFIFFRVRLHY